jgi:hypothetical protein
VSVRPSSFDDGAGLWTYAHDDATGGPHSGSLDPSTLTYGFRQGAGPGPPTQDNYDVIMLQCPACPDRSFHPASGGARAPHGDPAVVQEMFVRQAVTRGLAPQAAIDDTRARALRMDAHLGPAAWLVDEDALLSTLNQEASR